MNTLTPEQEERVEKIRKRWRGFGEHVQAGKEIYPLTLALAYADDTGWLLRVIDYLTTEPTEEKTDDK